MHRSVLLALILASLTACSQVEEKHQSKAADVVRDAATTENSLSEPATETKAPHISDGSYALTHRFAEHPNLPSIVVDAKVKNGRITLFNNSASDVFLKGIIAEGELFWHSTSGDWIIATSEEDKAAEHVGGCSDGPEVVDFKNLIYWTC